MRAMVPIVGENAHTNARGRKRPEPCANVVGNLVGIARQKRVVQIDEHAFHATGHDIALNIDLRHARKESIRSKRH